MAETKSSGDSNPVASLRERAQIGHEWLFGRALPLWAEVGFDRDSGCFNETVSQEGAPDGRLRRVSVQARQTAVFSQAGRLGWGGPWREMAEAGAHVLLKRALRDDGGTNHLLGPDGAPTDFRRDLYDLAFVVFGLAHAAIALGRGDLAAAAEVQIDWIEANWAQPAGGFAEGEVRPAPPRRQNPHMHLFEALLALHEATGDVRHLRRADAIRTLVLARMIDQERGALREYFTADWAPAPGVEGHIAEPGHMFEWCWLLHRHAARANIAPPPAAEALRRFAETHGVDAARGLVYDEIDIDGRPRRQTSRLWPHTERLKAHCVRYRLANDRDAAAAACAAFDMLWRYLETPIPGLWWDRRTESGALVAEAAPASSFYHIAWALFELADAARA